MAFPPRPGMIPPPGALSMPPFGMMPIGAPPPHHIRPPMFRGPPPNLITRTAPPVMNAPVDSSGGPSGPPVTVFVGNITERAQDAMVRHLLTSCGPIITWKRVQGATGRLQGFGFCEYANPDAAARAIRLLHDMLIVDKKLVVKVDAKTKDVLAEYKKQRRKEMTGKSPTQEESDRSDDDFIDAGMKHEDQMAGDRIKAIMMDHSKEMMNYVPHEIRRMDKRRDDNLQTGPKESLDDVEMEDGKRDIIHREIDKFRETMKIREAEKEEEKKKREKVDEGSGGGGGGTAAEGGSGGGGGGGGGRSGTSSRPRSRDKSKVSTRRSVTRSRSRSPSLTVVAVTRRERDSRSQSRRSRRRSRSRSRSRSRDRRSSRDRGGDRGRSSKELMREREKEDEEKELRRAERKARDKEASYQERLRKWESREGKKQSEHDKDRQKEDKRMEDVDKEGKKLREFLEDYDDDRDDEKYYKGRELERRLYEREREATKDAEDRQREKEEIEELKVQISQEGFRDPIAELHRRMAEQRMALPAVPAAAGVGVHENGSASAAFQQDHIQQQILVEADDDEVIVPQNSAAIMPPFYEQNTTPSPIITPNFNTAAANPVPPPSLIPPPQSLPTSVDAADNDDDDDYYDSMVHDDGGSDREDDDEDSMQPQQPQQATPPAVPPPTASASSSSSAPQMMKQPLHVSGRRKLEVKDVFNQDDDDVSVSSKKKKLPPLSSDRSKKEDHKSTEDKRKHIKSLIDKIPTDKNALFEYKVDWDMVDNQLMEKRIRPWVNKKIAEYIGEPEPTLTEFICSKVLAGSTPMAVLEDVQMVLDEEAEVFVVKMWRLLIYEIANKRARIMETGSSKQ